MEKSIIRYRPEIDGLRAFAVIPVILFHAGLSAFQGGFIGVDVFFVISGYLITSIIIDELGTGNFSLLKFYERRARRIMPALLFVVTICLPVAWLVMLPMEFKEFAQSIVAVSTFSSNILFWLQTGYFDTSAELKPLLHTWSLAVEEQYYIFFPVLVMLTWRLGKKPIAVILSLICVASLALAHWSAFYAPSTAYYLLPTRAWEIMLGALAALQINMYGPPTKQHFINQLASAFGFILILGSVFTMNARTPTPSIVTLVPTLGTVLVIAFSHQGTVVQRLLSAKPIVGIGLLSYSMYLWHQPLLAFARMVFVPSPPQALIFSLCIATVPLAYLTWYFIESPFKNKRTIPRRILISSVLLTSAAIIAFGITGYLSDGYIARYRNDLYAGDVGSKLFFDHLTKFDFPCTPKNIASNAPVWGSFVRCMQSKKSETIDFAIIGDSHAEQLFPGIADSMPDKNIVYYIVNGAPFLNNEDFKRIYENVLSTKSIKVVLMTMRYGTRLKLLSPGQNLAEQLTKITNDFAAAGKDVYIADDTPSFPFSAEACKWARWPFQKSTCVFEYSDEESSHVMVSKTLNNIVASNPAINLINIRKYFCDESICDMTKDRELFFRDDNHLNLLGSDYVGKKIAADYFGANIQGKAILPESADAPSQN